MDNKTKPSNKPVERSAHRYSAERKIKSNKNFSNSDSIHSSENKHGVTDGLERNIDEKDAADVINMEEQEREEEDLLRDATIADEETEEKKQQRLEEEKARMEEERQRIEKEKKLAFESKTVMEDRIDKRGELRKQNLEANQSRPAEEFFKKLDSSMKRNTAFVKKLRSITEQQKESLVNEFKGLNLTKFIQEAVTSIIEAKLKVADVSVAAYMCSLFHQRYSEFTPLFKRSILKIFDVINSKDDDKPGNVTRLRTALRLLGELILDGVFLPLSDGIQILTNIIQSIITADKSGYIFAPVVLTIVRHCGEDLAGLISRKHRRWKETVEIDFPSSQILTLDQKSTFICLFKEYYENMAKHVVGLHKDLQNRERQNRQTIGLRGELPQDRKEAFEKAQKIYEKLLLSTTTLSELLDEEMPDLPEDEYEEREEFGTINIFTPSKGPEYDSEHGLWEDEDTRTFYENVKDLKVLVPQILFKDAPSSMIKDVHKKTHRNDRKKQKERKLRVDLNVDDTTDFNDYDDLDDNFEDDILGEEADDDDTAIVGMAAIAEAYFQKLPTCVNRDFIDQAAEEFIMKLNTKGNRKKLVRALFTVNRIRFDLLPFYSRLVATLSPCLPNIGNDLVWLLKGSFRSHLRKKDQIHTESKIKTVRFIGELTKFKICPKAEALYCLRILLENFTHHNIDMACNLLETCGRFLYRSPESNPRMVNLLDQMMRKKSVQTMDSRHQTMIDNAFYYCNPPDRQSLQPKSRPPIHEYVRKLLYKDLSKTTTERVLRQVRKLPWNDDKVKSYVIKCIINVWNLKFNNVRCLANMLSGLKDYHDDVAIEVIDGVLENVRIGMETNVFRDNQRRLSSVKYLGELYNYQLVDSEIIFKTLYLLITFGGTLDMSQSELDPPAHLFRIRLVCMLLDTCGQYFDRGSTKKKLDCYLVYFQCYIWNKKESGHWTEEYPFPRDVEYMINDTLESLRPKLELFSSLEEANKAAEELAKEYEDKIKALSTPTDDDNGDLDSSLQSSPSPYGESPIASSPGGFSQSDQDEEDLDNSGLESGNDEYNSDAVAAENDDDIFVMENDSELHLREVPKYMSCEEDDVFKKDFDRMIGDSLTERIQGNTKAPNVDIAIPMNLRGKKKLKPNNADEESNDGVNFVLMLKKNNKQVLRGLNIPLTSDLAANIRNKQQAERKEHEEMKRLVLNYNQRQEEESYNELMSHFRPVKRGGGHGNRHQNKRGGHSRLRSRDAEQHLFNSSNRR